ncbi:MAG: signal peptidase I [Microthrixaceae bacterium]
MAATVPAHGEGERSSRSRALAIGFVGLVVLGWVLLAPRALGGSSLYVTTYGSSMEPALHRGDLAVVRPQQTYRVGDIVAYRSAQLKTIVLHRIVDRDGARFVFKGDNNSWTDVERPTADALIGKMTMRLPGLGNHLRRAASPPVVATLGAVAFFPLTRRDGRRRSRPRPPRHALRRHRSRPPVAWAQVEGRVLVATAVAVGALLVAFTRPEATRVMRDLPFDDRGEFTYSGAAPSGSAVYQRPQVTSPQPVFLNLVDRLDLGFTYEARSESPIDASGDISLTATVRDAGGWSYPIELAPTSRFDRGRGRIRGTLDLAALRSTLEAVQSATGVSRDQYTLVVQATVSRTVQRNAVATSGRFDATIEFGLDDLEMHLTTPGADALSPRSGGLLSVPTVRANQIDLLGRSLSIAAARSLAMALAVIAASMWLHWFRRAARAERDPRVAT